MRNYYGPLATVAFVYIWMLLQQAVTDKRAVRLRYHGHERIVCPHAGLV